MDCAPCHMSGSDGSVPGLRVYGTRAGGAPACRAWEHGEGQVHHWDARHPSSLAPPNRPPQIVARGTPSTAGPRVAMISPISSRMVLMMDCRSEGDMSDGVPPPKYTDFSGRAGSVTSDPVSNCEKSRRFKGRLFFFFLKKTSPRGCRQWQVGEGERGGGILFQVFQSYLDCAS